MREPILIARGLTKVFQTGATEVRALRGVDLEVHEREFMALVGRSGSGKTTLLNLIGALDVPTSAELIVLGHQVAALSRREHAELRLRSIGFVFQAYNLVLADEPTANLDGENAEILMHMMRDLRDRHGMTFLFSTHDASVIAHAVRIVTLVDGRVAGDERTAGEAPHEIVPRIGKAPTAIGGPHAPAP